MTGTANALFVGVGEYQLGALSENGLPNIVSTDGEFKYEKKNGKVKIEYKAKGDFTLNYRSDPAASYNISKGKIKVRGSVNKKGKAKGKGTIWGVDPFDPGRKKKLVTFDINGGFELALGAGLDLFGMSITNINCPLWDFCTPTETFYVSGEFGNDPTDIELDGAIAITTIPVPAAVWLFGTGLIGLVAASRRLNRAVI